jgi:predicted cytidylate kinase
MLISVSGPPGSGTTTAASGVASALGLDLVHGGEVFRTMAAEHGMSLREFGRYAAAQPEVDVELDRRLAVAARVGDVVIESRLAAWVLHNEGLDGLRVWIDCDDKLRAERVAVRESITIDQALRDNAERESVEHQRYQALYGIDLGDLSVYNLVLDSGTLGKDDVIERIVVAARARFGGDPGHPVP